MSVRVMSWVWEHSTASGTELLVLLAIADHADDYGANAWPSQERLAKRTRASVRTVQRAIDGLVARGELKRFRAAGGSAWTEDRYRPNQYAVLMSPGASNCQVEPGRGDTGDVEGRHLRQSGVTSTTSRGDTGVVLTILESPLNHPDPPAHERCVRCAGRRVVNIGRSNLTEPCPLCGEGVAL